MLQKKDFESGSISGGVLIPKGPPYIIPEQNFVITQGALGLVSSNIMIGGVATPVTLQAIRIQHFSDYFGLGLNDVNYGRVLSGDRIFTTVEDITFDSNLEPIGKLWAL